MVNSCKISNFKDGVLKEVNATKLTLIAENGRHIESVFTRSDKISVGDEIESDGHLILIDVSKQTKYISLNQLFNTTSIYCASIYRVPLFTGPSPFPPRGPVLYRVSL